MLTDHPPSLRAQIMVARDHYQSCFGRDPGGIFVTMLIGIVGAVLGGFIGRALGLYQPGEPAGFFVATLGAILLLFIYRKAFKPA